VTRRGSPLSAGTKKMALVCSLEETASHFPSGDQDIW
jgi:hypothetical protein